MDIKFSSYDGIQIGELISSKIEMHTTQDAVDLIMNCLYQGAECIILHRHQLAPDFFDLHTKLAGEILQKFSTYHARLAIIGDFSDLPGKRIHQFISESNKGGRINFVQSIDNAREIFRKF